MTYITIHQKGKRENNEDFLKTLPSQNIFMVCDGVGGSSKGEVASELACDTFEIFFSNNASPLSHEVVNNALLFTEEAFENYIAQNPDSKGMATTLTFVGFYNNKAICSHCGDSRIYHVRDGNILFKTKDHSLVNELVASGYITENEAKTHPKRNQITRAIMGTQNPTFIDTKVISEIQSNDFFLLCTDGILEGISEEDFLTLFQEGKQVSEIKQEIETKCLQFSNDNFSAIIIKI